ncbi:MAG TPA: hypothetical protein VK971_13130 [Thiohalobacter sp.]|nr:hypothetical protein [Thiohalobacter sp.]
MSSVFFTVISGVLVFVIAQILLRLWLDPITELKKTIGRVAQALTERADIYSNPGWPPNSLIEETRSHFRQIMSELEANASSIPFYSVTARIFGLPSQESIYKSSKWLNGISNSLWKNDLFDKNIAKAQLIKDALGIYTPENERIDIE